MLDEIKESYYNNADILKDWKKMSGNDLCIKYVELKENNDPLSENYLSAIIYKFWNVATKFYYSQGIKLATPEDCYNWLIDSIQYVLEHHVWTDQNHKLYKDPKAPEKAINVVFNSTKINFFVANTRQKRKIDATSISLDGISEETSDAYFLPVYDNYDLNSEEFKKIIVSYYNNYEYFSSICLDLIINEDVVDKSEDINVKYKKLKWRLKTLDDNYAELFSSTYGLDYGDVKRTIEYISNLDYSSIEIKLNRLINTLKHSNNLLDILSDE